MLVVSCTNTDSLPKGFPMNKFIVSAFTLALSASAFAAEPVAAPAPATDSAPAAEAGAAGTTESPQVS